MSYLATWFIFLTPLSRESHFFFETKKTILGSKIVKSIPAVFHCIWIGPKPFPISSLKNLRSFKKFHPHAQFIFWSDKPLDPILDFLECKIVDPSKFYLSQAYINSQNVGQKSDIARLEILNQFGGIYIDHDALCTKSLSNLIKSSDFVIGSEPGKKKLGIGLILSKPAHPIIQAALKNLKIVFQESPSLLAKITDKRAVIDSTYAQIGKAVHAFAGPYDLIVPSCYFYPKNSPPIYSKHFYASSWIQDYSEVKDDPTNQLIKKNYYYLKWTIILILITTLFFLKNAPIYLLLVITTPLYSFIEHNIHIPFFNRHTITRSDEKALKRLMKMHPSFSLFIYSNHHLNPQKGFKNIVLSSNEAFIEMFEVILNKGGYCIDPGIELKTPINTLVNDANFWAWKGCLTSFPLHTPMPINPALFAAKKNHPILKKTITCIKNATPKTYNQPHYQFYHKIIIPFHLTLQEQNATIIDKKLHFSNAPFFIEQTSNPVSKSNLRWVKKTQKLTRLIFLQMCIFLLFLVFKKVRHRYSQ